MTDYLAGLVKAARNGKHWMATFIVMAALLSTLAAGIEPAVAAVLPPGNDDISGATPATTLPFTTSQDSLTATPSPSDPTPSCGSFASNSVWYSYTPAASGTIQATTTGGDGFPPTPTAYSGPAHATTSSPLTEVSCSTSGAVQLNVTAGVTYYFLLGSYSPRPSFTFTIQIVVPPVNDDISGATPVTALPFSALQAGQYATHDPRDPTPSCIAANDFTTWYSFTPSTPVAITASGGLSAVYSGPAHAGSSTPLLEVACADDFQLSLAAGVTYYFMLGAFVTPPPVTFGIQQIVAPSNDEVGGATAVGALPYNNVQDTLNATRNPSDSAPSCGSPANHSVWYSYAPTVGGTIQATSSGGDYFPPTPTAYSGPAHATASAQLTEAACSTSGVVQLNVAAGKTYYFLLGSYSPRPSFTFTVQAVVPPANDEIAGAVTVGPLPFSSGQDSQYASQATSDPTPSCGSPAGYSVWYSYTPTANGTIQAISGGGDSFPPTPTVYSGSAHATASTRLTEELCSISDVVQLNVRAGRTYYFMLGSYTPRPAFTFTLQMVPSVLPGGTTSTEGDSGTISLAVPVTLSSPSALAVTVPWTTIFATGAPGNQADPGTDYTPASGTVTFNPGETAKTILVQINGDAAVEPDEYILVSFHDPTNAKMGGFWGLGFASIANDDHTTAPSGTGSVH